MSPDPFDLPATYYLHPYAEIIKYRKERRIDIGYIYILNGHYLVSTALLPAVHSTHRRVTY